MPFLKKNCNPFTLFPFINTPSQMIKWKFLYILLTPFYYNPPPPPFFPPPPPPPPIFLPTQPPFNQSHFFSEKWSHAYGSRYFCFLQNAESFLTKHKKCSLEASYGTSQTSKLQPFIRKVNRLKPKTISAK